MSKVQFNTRVQPKVRDVATRVADAASFTRDDITEAALAALFGTSDEFLRAKIKKARAVAKHLKLSLSFNAPGAQSTGLEMAA